MRETLTPEDRALLDDYLNSPEAAKMTAAAPPEGEVSWPVDVPAVYAKGQDSTAPRELLRDTDGENLAVRAFLMYYGCGNHNVREMRAHLANSGFDGYWPAWADTEVAHLTKGGAQDWLRHLFALERAAAPEKAGGDAERLDWVERTNPIIFHKTYVGAQWAIVTDAEADNEVLADTLREAIDAARGSP